MQDNKNEKPKFGYEWLEALQWHVGGNLNFKYESANKISENFKKFPYSGDLSNRYVFLIEKKQASPTVSLKPDGTHIHSLALLGFMICFAKKPGLTLVEFQNQLLKNWVLKNGLPVCTSQFPYHRMVTTCDHAIRSAPGTLKLLIDFWPLEHQFEIYNPEYFLMCDTTLRALAIDAFIIYSEVCLIFDPKFKLERKKRQAAFKSTISENDVCKALFDIGKVLFAKEILDEDIQFSTYEKLPPQMMLIYGNKFADLWVRMAASCTNKQNPEEFKKNPLSHRDKDVSEYLGRIFDEIENYLYRVHLRLSTKGELANGMTIQLNMSVTVPDLLSLCWMELFLLAKSEGSYGLRLCKAVNCPNGFFVPKRKDQKFCCDLCRSGQNIKDARARPKEE